ncbi:MAG: hypothetical protein O7J95_19895, partial [Planctomycetota bacterium]|nr:hypothetical protein [Planctomycetota bacterium]
MKSRIGLLFAGYLLVACWSPVGAAPQRFDPERHFPTATYFYVDVDFGALRRGWKTTPLGAIATHPGVRKALGKLPEEAVAFLNRETRDFEHETGISLMEFFDLFRGRGALTIPEVDFREGPRILVALEMGRQRKKILAFVERMCTRGFPVDGEPRTESVLGHDVKVYQTRWGGPTVRYAAVGGTLAFSVGLDLEDFIRRIEGKKTKGRLRSNKGLARVRSQASGMKSLVTAFLDVEKSLEKAREGMESLGGPLTEFQTTIEALGLDKVSSVSYQLALTDGDWESKFVVLSPGGLSGALKLIADTFSGPRDHSVISKVPASASALSCYSIHAGRLLREGKALLDKLSEVFPEMGEPIDLFQRSFEEFTGLSVRRDLYSLPRIDLHSFYAMPPAKSALPDFMLLCRTSELSPYIRLLDRVARKLGASVEPLEAGDHTLAYLKVSGLLRRLGLVPPAARERAGSPFTADVGFSLVFAAVDEEWMLVTGSPQSARRYLDVYARGKKLSDVPEVKDFLQANVPRGAAFDLLRDGKALLWLYNSAVSAANLLAPKLKPFLEPFGVEPAHLPPAEEFSGHFRQGFVIVRARKDSIVIHSHRAFTNLLGSSLSMVGSFAPGLLAAVVPARMGAQQAVALSPVATAETRLRELYGTLEKYARESGTRAFPHSSRGSVAAFGKLLDSGVLA